MSATFHEIELPEGYLSVTWIADTPREWRRILQMIKTNIPKVGRSYVPESKTWTIAPDYLLKWNEIKSLVENHDSEKVFIDVDEVIESDYLLRIAGENLVSLPDSMKERAVFALRAACGFIDVEVEFSLSKNMFAAWNDETQVWFYEDGRYSQYSPVELDHKALDAAHNWLQLIESRFSTFMARIDSTDGFYQTRVQFRKQMLEKYDFQCYVCEKKPKKLSKLHMHRVLPGKLGGQYIEENVVILCASCHRQFEGRSWEDIHSHNNNGTKEVLDEKDMDKN